MYATSTQLHGISLRELLPEARFTGGEDICIGSLSADSRRCQPGDLFAALVGAEHDGHDFAQQAIENGAQSLLTERLLPTTKPTCIVPNSREALGKICQALAGNPSHAMQMIGVTGASGKTTTALLIAAVLKADRRRVGMTTDQGYSDSFQTMPARETTPSPMELANWLSRMTLAGCSAAVIELSSQALASYRAAGIAFDAAVITNLKSMRHNSHGDPEKYRRIKARILQQLKPSGFSVFNTDDAASRRLLNKTNAASMTVSLDGFGELSATLTDRHRSEQTFLLSAGSETVPVRTRIIGDHYILSCMQAAAVGLVMGVDLATIVRGLESVQSIPGRLERIECGQAFSVFVDAADHPDRLATCLKTVREVTSGRVICIYGATGNADRAMRPLLGRAAERFADHGVITNDNPGLEPPLAIAHDILDGYQQPRRGHILPNREEAIRYALRQARPGDSVVIAGKGNRNRQVVGHVEQPFDDREVARQWLHEQANSSFSNSDLSANAGQSAPVAGTHLRLWRGE